MADRFCIAVDAMSGDLGPDVAVRSSLSFLKRHEASSLLLVGDEAVLQSLLATHSIASSVQQRLEIVHAPDVVEMTDKPSLALRKKQQSSMAVALGLVKERRAQACVSAGNTGALMILGRSILRMLPGIDRPAIVKRIPARNAECYLLDLGANVDCSAEQLLQFGIMGAIHAELDSGVSQPKVALLNVGTEDIKGNEQVRLAAHLFREQEGVNYVGFIEGDAIFTGVADVIVCDGFVGNVALKTGEGIVSLVLSIIKDTLSRSLYGRVVGLLALPLLKAIRRQLEPSYYNGAELLGLQGVVIKSHGGADQFAFEMAIRQALNGVKQNAPARMNERLDAWLM